MGRWENLYVLSRASHRRHVREYVQYLPGHDAKGAHPLAGKDWGWTNDRTQAMAVPQWWADRWSAFYMGRNDARMDLALEVGTAVSP